MEVSLAGAVRLIAEVGETTRACVLSATQNGGDESEHQEPDNQFRAERRLGFSALRANARGSANLSAAVPAFFQRHIASPVSLTTLRFCCEAR